MSAFILHQFSPQRTDPKILNETLVARRPLLDEVLDKIRTSVSSGAQHHFLLIGPRGIGKTNFLTLVQHDLCQEPTSTPNLRVAWLHEDEISGSFLPLLLRVYRSLESAYPTEFAPEILESIRGQSQEVALARLTDALVAAAAGRKILILMENVDAHFSKMKDEEQMRWRAFMQNHKNFITLASAQKLTNEISRRAKPFFNFFDVRTLKPLSVDEARDLLIRIAVARQGEHDPKLIQFLETPRGLARLKAIHTLAGGNPRLYVLLSELLTAEDLDDVVNAFEEMVDRQLTTYYQERLRWVSSQQQEIIHELCRARSPISVNRIAQGIFATNQTVSRQLKELSDMGYVQSNSLGRESVYELAEPLMRLVLEAKQSSNGGRLKLIVDFLQLWFERPELEQRLEFCESEITRGYLEEALRGSNRIGSVDENTWLQGVVSELAAISAETDPERLAQLISGVLERPQLPEEFAGFLFGRLATAQLSSGNFAGVLDAAEIALRSESVAPSFRSLLHQMRSTAFQRNGDPQKALEALTEAEELAIPDERTVLLLHRANIYQQMGDGIRAESVLNDVLKMNNLPDQVKIRALLNRAQALKLRGSWQDVVATLDEALGLKPLTPEERGQAVIERASALNEGGDSAAALDALSQAIELATTPTQLRDAHRIRAEIHEARGDNISAARDLSSAVDIPDLSSSDRASALTSRAIFYIKGKKFELALKDANDAIDCSRAGQEWTYYAYFLRGIIHELVDQDDEALADFDSALKCGPSIIEAAMRQGVALHRAALLVRLGQVAAAGLALEQVLDAYVAGPLGVSPDPYGGSLGILAAQELAGARKSIRKLVSVAATAGELGILGTELVQQLVTFQAAEPGPKFLHSWEEAWKEAAAGHTELEIPLRLLQAGLRYLAEPHERFLLALPLEERQLLRSTLGLD